MTLKQENITFSLTVGQGHKVDTVIAEALANQWTVVTTVAQIKERYGLDVLPDMVQRRAQRRFGKQVRATDMNKGHTSADRWSADEDEFLVMNYASMTLIDMADYMSRSYSAIRNRTIVLQRKGLIEPKRKKRMS